MSIETTVFISLAPSLEVVQGRCSKKGDKELM